MKKNNDVTGQAADNDHTYSTLVDLSSVVRLLSNDDLCLINSALLAYSKNDCVGSSRQSDAAYLSAGFCSVECSL